MNAISYTVSPRILPKSRAEVCVRCTMLMNVRTVLMCVCIMLT